MLHEVWEGVLSLRKVHNLPLYLFYSLLIWVGYFLHFYIAFSVSTLPPHYLLGRHFSYFVLAPLPCLCPPPTERALGICSKTMLVLYGVAEPQAVMFALVVHTIQTALVVLLGAFGWARVNYRKNFLNT